MIASYYFVNVIWWLTFIYFPCNELWLNLHCVIVIAAVAASAPRKSLGSSSSNSSPSSQCSTPGQFQPTATSPATRDAYSHDLISHSQQRASMLAATRCVLVQHQLGRKASETSLAVPQGNLRRKTSSPRRLRMMKRLEEVACQRPAESKVELLQVFTWVLLWKVCVSAVLACSDFVDHYSFIWVINWIYSVFNQLAALTFLEGFYKTKFLTKISLSLFT